jgi:hypothetical protein
MPYLFIQYNSELIPLGFASCGISILTGVYMYVNPKTISPPPLTIIFSFPYRIMPKFTAHVPFLTLFFIYFILLTSFSPLTFVFSPYSSTFSPLFSSQFYYIFPKITSADNPPLFFPMYTPLHTLTVACGIKDCPSFCIYETIGMDSSWWRYFVGSIPRLDWFGDVTSVLGAQGLRGASSPGLGHVLGDQTLPRQPWVIYFILIFRRRIFGMVPNS